MKSMKKLVLAGLILLASVVVLAGCDTQLEPEPESTTVNDTVEEIPFLAFSAKAERSMTISTCGTYTLHESLEYSVNGGDWKQLVVRIPITFGGENGDLRLRGKSAGGTGTDYNNYAKVRFGNSDVMVSCTGDIRTLVEWEDHTTASTSEARFPCLFSGCTSNDSRCNKQNDGYSFPCRVGILHWIIPAVVVQIAIYWNKPSISAIFTPKWY